MKKILLLIITTIVSLIIIIPISLYIFNKTIGKWDTDCMIRYINNSYPNWYIYMLNFEWVSSSLHIDSIYYNENSYLISRNKYWEILSKKRFVLSDWRDLIEKIWKVEGCNMDIPLYMQVYNIPYCRITLFFEKWIIF